MKRQFLWTGLLLSVVAFSACGKSDTKKVEEPADDAAATAPKSAAEEEHVLVDTEKLEPYECGDVARIHTLGGVFLASQPGQEDLKLAKEGGIKTVVNLRQPDELEWDEAAVVQELGMEYHNIPFKSPDGMTDDVLDQVRALLNDESKRPLLLHCSSANRVGGVWLAHRMVDDGLSAEEAEAEATEVGMKLPAYGEKAKDYAARMMSETATQ